MVSYPHTFIMKKLVTIFLTLLTLGLGAAEPDYSVYDQLLKKYTFYGTKGGIRGVLVKYTKLRKEPKWQEVVKMIETYNTSKLSNYRERAAFFINAYNVHAINAILKKPTLSIYQLFDSEYQIKQFRGDNKVELGLFPNLNLSAKQIFAPGTLIH